MKKQMTIDDIKEPISVDESRTLELKNSTDDLKNGYAFCVYISKY